MSLTSSLHIATGGLQAAQTGLQVVGNNIANVNTPDYIRQEAVFTPATTETRGNLRLGLGVLTTAVVQRYDKFLEERLRNARSDVGGAEAEELILRELEGIIGELGDTDLSTELTTFFGRIKDVIDQPEDPATRNLVVLQGQALAGTINSLYSRVQTVRKDVDSQINGTVNEINALTKKVADLNIQIVAVEGGSTQKTDAIGLRDERNKVLRQLSELIDIRTTEQSTGAVTVFVAGDYLVAEGRHRPLAVHRQEAGVELQGIQIRLADSQSPIKVGSGKLAGQIAARDEHLDGFLKQLDTLAGSLIQEFNKLHAGGQGLIGQSNARAEHAVSSSTAPLDAAGLKFPPDHGSVTVIVRDKLTGETTTREITVRLLGLPGDSSLDDIASQLNAVEGLTASIDPTGRLTLAAATPTVEFAFADDTAGLGAALGLGTFFTGTGAANIGVSQQIARDPRLLATSGGGIGQDTQIAVQLASLLEKPLGGSGGRSLAEMYEKIVADTVQSSHNVSAASDAFRVFRNTLESQKLSQSGVNIDEEAVRMISFQYAYQANAKLITTVRDLLQLLMTL